MILRYKTDLFLCSWCSFLKPELTDFNPRYLTEGGKVRRLHVTFVYTLDASRRGTYGLLTHQLSLKQDIDQLFEKQGIG